jgi:hypothetical protein
MTLTMEGLVDQVMGHRNDAGQMLARCVLDGYWTLEQLDQPSASHNVANAWRVAHKLSPIEYRNLARDWIAAHPTEWDLLLRSKLRDEIEGDVG